MEDEIKTGDLFEILLPLLPPMKIGDFFHLIFKQVKLYTEKGVLFIEFKNVIAPNFLIMNFIQNQ